MLKYIALQIKTTNSDTMNPLFSQIAFDEKKRKEITIVLLIKKVKIQTL